MNSAQILKLFAIVLFICGSTGRQLIACEADEVEVRIVVVADNFPQEILWTFFDAAGVPVADGGAGEFTFCVGAGECRRWVITDSANDGICCQFGLGFYQIFVDGVEVQTGGDYGSSAEHQINCPPGLVCESALNVTEGLHSTLAEDSWYAFTPSQNGEYKMSSCAGLSCESIVFVYEECLSSFDLGPVGALAFNEDACSNGNASVQVGLQAGVKYFIRFHNQACENNFTWNLTYEGEITGCMDETACNFNPFATIEAECLYFPDENCPGGFPDLEVDQSVLSSSFQLDTEDIQDACLINEGCASGYGVRTILRFTTTIHNIGEADYVIGQTPSNNEDTEQFEWDQCHNHWHYEGYAAYELFDSNNNALPTGFKNGFCVLDLSCPSGDMFQYTCNTMGISAGCSDTYDASIPCQWLDITGLEAGDYTMVVKVNWDETPDLHGRTETNYENNYAKVCFSYTPDQGSGASLQIIENCAAPTDCAGAEYGPALIDCEGECDGLSIMGDINKDGARNFEDVDAIVQEVVSGNANALNTCSDLNGDNELNIIDAYYLYACYLQELAGGTDDPNNDNCGFPYGTDNTQQTTTFSNLGINLEQGFVDIGISNPLNEVVAFEFNLSGIRISNISSLLDQEGLVTALNYNDETGKVTGYVISDDPIFKHSETTEFLRVHFEEITNTDNQVCIQSIDAIVNELLEVINPLVSSACQTAIASGIDDLTQGDLKNLTISPNPFTTRTRITFPNSSAESYSISLFDASGNRVYYRTGIIEEELIIEGVAGGQVYTFVLESKKIYYTGKLVCLR